MHVLQIFSVVIFVGLWGYNSADILKESVQVIDHPDKNEYQFLNAGSDKHKYGYEINENRHFHHTTTEEDGVRLGCYGYVLYGKKYSTQYVADVKGYRPVNTHDPITVYPKSGDARQASFINDFNEDERRSRNIRYFFPDGCKGAVSSGPFPLPQPSEKIDTILGINTPHENANIPSSFRTNLKIPNGGHEPSSESRVTVPFVNLTPPFASPPPTAVPFITSRPSSKNPAESLRPTTPSPIESSIVNFTPSYTSSSPNAIPVVTPPSLPKKPSQGNFQNENLKVSSVSPPIAGISKRLTRIPKKVSQKPDEDNSFENLTLHIITPSTKAPSVTSNILTRIPAAQLQTSTSDHERFTVGTLTPPTARPPVTSSPLTQVPVDTLRPLVPGGGLTVDNLTPYSGPSPTDKPSVTSPPITQVPFDNSRPTVPGGGKTVDNLTYNSVSQPTKKPLVPLSSLTQNPADILTQTIPDQGLTFINLTPSSVLPPNEKTFVTTPPLTHSSLEDTLSSSPKPITEPSIYSSISVVTPPKEPVDLLKTIATTKDSFSATKSVATVPQENITPPKIDFTSPKPPTGSHSSSQPLVTPSQGTLTPAKHLDTTSAPETTHKLSVPHITLPKETVDLNKFTDTSPRPTLPIETFDASKVIVPTSKPSTHPLLRTVSEISSPHLLKTSKTDSCEKSCCEDDESAAKIVLSIPIKGAKSSGSCGMFAKLIIPIEGLSPENLKALKVSDTNEVIKNILKALY